jgi:hypothetical protein
VTTPTAAYTNALLWFLGDGTAPKVAFDAALGAPVPFYLTGRAIHVVLGLWLAVRCRWGTGGLRRKPSEPTPPIPNLGISDAIASIFR